MYPQSVLTKNKKGEAEVRQLLKRGRFVLYRYLDPETGRPAENGKMRLFLKSDKEEGYFLIPLKQGGRFLALKAGRRGKEIKLWDGRKPVNLWE
jgi:hypothetical protein